jgi:5-methyltetrahydropteroyltriglutamate--homocysteine methyltransferase
LRLEELLGGLRTTVIGSFPLPHSYENMARALRDQVEAGVDYPCYGQLMDMNLMFLKPLAEQGCGFELRGGEVWLVGEPKPPSKPIAVELLKFALNLLSQEGLACRVLGVKVPITGPVTLSYAVKVTESHRAVEYPDLVLAMADVVAEVVRQNDEAGAKLITLDEPALPYALQAGLLKEEEALEALDRLAKAFSKAIPSLHCCGAVRPVAQLLLQSKIPVLSHAFKAEPRNLEAYTRRDLEAYDKVLGLGCVDSNPDPQLMMDVGAGRAPWSAAVESVEEVEAFIVKAGERLGFERLLIHPDCGFGGLKAYFKDDSGHLIAVAKLKSMVEAARRARRKAGLKPS